MYRMNSTQFTSLASLGMESTNLVSKNKKKKNDFQSRETTIGEKFITFGTRESIDTAKDLNEITWR